MSDTYSSIKTVLSDSFKNFWSVLKPKIDDSVSTLDKKIDDSVSTLDKKIDDSVSTLDTGYKLLAITNLGFNETVDAGKSVSVSKKFTKNENASLFYPVLMSSGWGAVNNLKLFDDTVSFNFLNTSSGSHGCYAQIAVFQFGKF